MKSEWVESTAAQVKTNGSGFSEVVWNQVELSGVLQSWLGWSQFGFK